MTACFNSQPPEGGWPLSTIYLNQTSQFQLTAARRRLDVMSILLSKEQAVSTHSRPKAAGSYRTSVLNSLLWFQLTAARRRLEIPPYPRKTLMMFQLTAARRRLATPAANFCSNTSVSTHSRPKAAGCLIFLIYCFIRVSTHSRPKAAGLRGGRGGGAAWCFNSQPPEGGWGFIFTGTGNRGCFNSQPPEGGWLNPKDSNHGWDTLFQLTAARRRLAIISRTSSSRMLFQLTAARRRLVCTW